MSIAGADKKFGLNDPEDALRKLNWEIDSLRKVNESNFDAVVFTTMNCAITTQMVSDWVYFAFENHLKSVHKDEKAYAKHISGRCEAVKACWAVANECKHHTLNGNKHPEVSTVASATAVTMPIVAVFTNKEGAQEVIGSKQITYKSKILIDRVGNVDRLVALDVFTEVYRFWETQIEDLRRIHS